jgi:hypothetical protein
LWIGLLLLLTVPCGCRYSEVALSALSVKCTVEGEILLRFNSDEELIDRNPQPLGYLRIQGGANPRPPEKGAGWNCCASLERVPASGEFKVGDQAGFRYAFRFPVQAVRKGKYPMAGFDQRALTILVETPYSLGEPGEYTLEFWLLGNVPDGFPNVVDSKCMVLTYRVP